MGEACEDEADKRVKNVFLTAKGEESCKNAMDCYQKSQHSITYKKY
jgi:DNA-binding MarR family transcriptional regulator